MQDITKLIEKYGPELSKSLGIASTDLYAKLIWYTRVDGIKMLIMDTVGIALFWVMILLAFRFINRVTPKEDRSIAYFFGSFLVFVVWSVVFLLFITGLANDIAKIIVPEYALINQFMTLIGK